MIKRIAINPSYGLFHIPSQFLGKVNESDKNFRVVVAEYIDDLKDTHETINQDVYEKFRKSSDWYIKCGNHFYFRDLDDEYNQVFGLEIVDVDTSKKWKIKEYDGAEDIVYYSEPRLIDKELNMWEW